MNRVPSTWEKVNWLDREEIVGYLESIGMACYDDEPTQDLREALVENIESGEIILND